MTARWAVRAADRVLRRAQGGRAKRGRMWNAGGNPIYGIGIRLSNALRLLELPEHMQEALQDGTISEGHGRALLMLLDPTKKETLFQRMKKTKMSVRQAEEAARALLQPAAIKLPKPPEVSSFENDLQAALGTKVEVRYGKKMSKGLLIIQYNSLEELDNLANRLKTKLL